MSLRVIIRRLKKVNSRLRIMLVCLVILCIVGAFIQSRRQLTAKDWRYCFMDPLLHSNLKAVNESNSPRRLEDVVLTDFLPTPGRSIFFHETTCAPMNSANIKINDIGKKTIALNARQACAIESTALHNPNFDVFVLFATPTFWDNETEPRLPLIDAITSYKNVHLRNLNLWTYAAGTPIYSWLQDGDLFYSDYVQSHVSDFLRFLTLWRWGGTYLDMDIVMLRTIEDLKPNYAGVESEEYVAAGVINLSHDGFGHEMAKDCLNDFETNFKGSKWGNNGPGVITRVLQKACGIKDIKSIMLSKLCDSFHLFDRNAFYEIRYSEWYKFFEETFLSETLNRTSNSYLIHVWNKVSNERTIRIGSNTAYGIIAEKNCPKVFASAGQFL